MPSDSSPGFEPRQEIMAVSQNVSRESDTKAHVLHFSESFGGGVQSVIHQYSQLSQVRHSLLVRARKGVANETQRQGYATLETVDSLRSLIRSWNSAKLKKYDIIHAHSSMAGLIARVSPHPTAFIVYSPHALAFDGHESRLVRILSRFVERTLAHRTQAAIAVSLNEANLLQGIGIKEGNVFLVPHNIRVLEPRTPVEAIRNIVSVGRLSYQKNPHALVEVKRLADDQGMSNLNWTWVGDGDHELRRILENSGIRVTGWATPEEVSDYLGQADVYFHPARYEGMPVSVIEALAAGVPSVISSIRAHEGISSAFFFANSEQAFAHLKELANTDVWLAASKRSQIEVQLNFNSQVQQTQLYKAYEAALGGRTLLDG